MLMISAAGKSTSLALNSDINNRRYFGRLSIDI